MSALDYYLKRHLYCKPQIGDQPPVNLEYIIVIPCYNEPDILKTLDSLLNCELPECDTEVIIVVNNSVDEKEGIKKQNRNTISEIREWSGKNKKEGIRFYVIDKTDLPSKYAGAGLARKIGMDEAVARFSGINNPDGKILSLDADTVADSNYFTEIDRAFRSNPDATGCNIHFEHPVSGDDYSQDVYNAIVQYELHLRYFTEGLKFTGFPYPYHTVGSCFGVKAGIYAKQGGMNKRKAGEDFYFLHKIFPLGKFIRINTTRVIPSPRPSFRVPFGTGPVIEKLTNNSETGLLTYNPQAFHDLKLFFSLGNRFYKKEDSYIRQECKALPGALKEFLGKIDYLAGIREINNNSGSLETYEKRFFNRFNAFRIIKYLNFAHEIHYQKIYIKDACKTLLEMLNIKENSKNTINLLLLYRNLNLACKGH